MTGTEPEGLLHVELVYERPSANKVIEGPEGADLSWVQPHANLKVVPPTTGTEQGQAGLSTASAAADRSPCGAASTGRARRPRQSADGRLCPRTDVPR